MERQNYRRLLVSLTDTIITWVDEMAESDEVKLPYIGNNSAVHMAEAAMATLVAIGDVYDSLVEQGEIKP